MTEHSICPKSNENETEIKHKGGGIDLVWTELIGMSHMPTTTATATTTTDEYMDPRKNRDYYTCCM